MATKSGDQNLDTPFEEEGAPTQGVKRERGHPEAGNEATVDRDHDEPSKKKVGAPASSMYPMTPTSSSLMPIAPEPIGHHLNLPMGYGAMLPSGGRMQPMDSMAQPRVNIAGSNNVVNIGCHVQSATSIFPGGVRSQHSASLVGGVPSHHSASLGEKGKQFIQQLKRKYSTLTGKVRPIPFSKEKRTIEEVFTEVGIKGRPANGKETTLSSYRELITGPTGQSRVQIIEGEPGYGKSMLSLRLAHDWCIDEPHVKNIDILIYLNLRQLGGMKSIHEAIVKCLRPLGSSISESDVEQLLLREDIKTLILFDAYDEYPDKDIKGNFVSQILGGNLLPHISVLLTTRSSCIPEEFDGRTGRIKLTGFNERARREYVHKVVTRGDDEATNKIITQFNTNSILGDICQVPLFSVIYAHSVHETGRDIDFSSVTTFFEYLVCCFHVHAENKGTEEERAEFQKFRDNHDELDELSYEALSAENQQLTWDEEITVTKLGKEFYKRHVDIGILVEEEVLNSSYPKQPNPYKVEVRFFHKLLTEWYAAHHLVKLLMSSPSSLPENILDLMHPSDLQHVYRFACGLDPLAAPRVLDLLRLKEDCNSLAVLCALEQKDTASDVLDTVCDLVSRDVRIRRDDSRLLQRTTLELVQRACEHGIPVSCLRLESCFRRFDVTNSCIVLESDFRLANMKHLKVLHMTGWYTDVEITRDKLLGLLQTCEGLTELWVDFDSILLPLSIPPETIPPALRRRNINILYDRGNGLVYRLSFDHGQWEIHDQHADQSFYVEIDQGQSQLEQEWCLQELKMAAEAGVTICALLLGVSFNTVADNGQSIILTSGLTIPGLPTLQELYIEETNINQEMFIKILSYVKECPQMTWLHFVDSQLPGVVDPEQIPSQLKQQGLEVLYDRRSGLVYRLSFDHGQWEIHDQRADSSLNVSIDQSDSQLEQEWCLQELKMAAEAGVKIHVLSLVDSFNTVADNSQLITLTSGRTIPVLQTLLQLDIWETDINQEMFIKILSYVKECPQMTTLLFWDSQMPDVVDPEQIPSQLEQRGLKVHSWKHGYLDFETGRWKLSDRVAKISSRIVVKGLYQRILSTNFGGSEETRQAQEVPPEVDG